MSLNAKLLVVGGDVKTTEIHLKLPATIGRGRDVSIVLPHPLVSRRHCELFEAAGQLMVRDLGSLNGTFVNSERVTESPLPAGELLTIGTVTFRAHYEAGTHPRRAPGDKTVEFSKTKTIVADADDLADDVPAPRPANADRLKQTVAGGDHSAVNRNTKTEPVVPIAKKNAAPGGDEATLDFSDGEDDGEDDDETAATSASDDDLNDFLKGLGK